RFLFERLYSIPMFAEEHRLAAERISALFDFFLNHPDKLPENHRERIRDFPMHRVVCDYIAGMTNGYFRKTAARFLG
ncbi:MAG: deoxyguanosinetriphosphate triphosphohydrolase, partial [Bryobacteraceae bacterium]